MLRTCESLGTTIPAVKLHGYPVLAMIPQVLREASTDCPGNYAAAG